MFVPPPSLGALCSRSGRRRVVGSGVCRSVNPMQPLTPQHSPQSLNNKTLPVNNKAQTLNNN